jgi:hypothetical protein
VAKPPQLGANFGFGHPKTLEGGPTTPNGQILKKKLKNNNKKCLALEGG